MSIYECVDILLKLAILIVVTFICLGLHEFINFCLHTGLFVRM